MGNIVWYAARPDLPPLEMSNGLTSVIIAVLALAASRIAATDHEKELAAWIGSRDQNVVGLGIVGFDIGKMPWAGATLDQDKAFLLRAIAGAKAKTGWDRLDYSPREDWVMERLDQLAVLVTAFGAKDIAGSERAWPWGSPEVLEMCEKHGVYRHLAGCVICNDR